MKGIGGNDLPPRKKLIKKLAGNIPKRAVFPKAMPCFCQGWSWF